MANQGQGEVCPIHNVYMREYSNEKGSWWSHKSDDGKWCYGESKFPKKPSALPKVPAPPPGGFVPSGAFTPPGGAIVFPPPVPKAPATTEPPGNGSVPWHRYISWGDMLARALEVRKNIYGEFEWEQGIDNDVLFQQQLDCSLEMVVTAVRKQMAAP